jgi:hypothetical protein
MPAAAGPMLARCLPISPAPLSTERWATIFVLRLLAINWSPGEWAIRRDHFRLMADLLILALQADVTRIATLVMATEGNRRSYPELGFTEEHHGVSHHTGNPVLQEKFTKINEHHAGEMAYLVDRVSKLHEGDGSLLDNCMIVYGGGMADGNAHAHADIPTVLFGKGGGTIDPGRHVVCPPNTPICNLWLSLMERMGVEVERFGDSSGKVTQLKV